MFVHLMPFLYALFVLQPRLTGDSRLTIEEMREDNGDKLLPKPLRLLLVGPLLGVVMGGGVSSVIWDFEKLSRDASVKQRQR